MTTCQIFAPFLTATATTRITLTKASEAGDPRATGRSIAQALRHTLNPVVLAIVAAELQREAGGR